MVKLLINILSVIITSFYFFPFEFIFFPGVNTKMAMAVIGLLVLGKKLAQEGGSIIDKNLFNLSLITIGISLVSLLTMTYNNTNDPSFITYFVSMWVWLGGAYCLVRWLEFAYGKVTVMLVCNHLIAVCVMQCLLAFIMGSYVPLKNFVDSFIGGEAYMGRAETRMYGIGAALDVAGLRFASVAVIIGFLLSKSKRLSDKEILFYILSLMVLAVIGNMMSRTTTMGIGIALVYILYSNCLTSKNAISNNRRFWTYFVIILCIILPVVIFLYNTDYGFYKNLRFAFEGFFSLWETGKWEVTSNDILFEYMIVFPDNLKTWLIGDGYAANPSYDPYYTGVAYNGFYKGTDIGYLRFIFYFGVIGTFLLVLFFLKVAFVCVKKFKVYKTMFFLILLVNYIGWFKVSTDIFLTFAPFLCLKDESMEE